VQESVNNPTKDFAIHYFNYGKLLQTDSKRQQEAIYCFRQAIKIKPDFAEAYDCLQYNSDIISSY
jgi:tetratricopeptide (TPR) repeat protein